MRGSAMSGSTLLPGISTVRNRPAGKPALEKISSIASAQRGTFEACFKTAPLPAMSAGAANRKTCQNGKFQGMIASTTPSGSNATKLSLASVEMCSSARKLAACSA